MIFETRATVAFDLDDVLANFIDPFIAINAKIHNRPDLIGQKPVDWEWTNLNLTKEQLDAAWDVVNNTHDFWANLPMETGADPFLVYKVWERTNSVFPTARAYAPGTMGESVAHQSARFLLNNYSIPFPTVIVGNSKGPLAAALKYDYFIDDRPKNVLEVKAARPECQVFLKDSSHNKTFSHPDIPRIPSVNEFCKIILEG